MPVLAQPPLYASMPPPVARCRSLHLSAKHLLRARPASADLDTSNQNVLVRTEGHMDKMLGVVFDSEGKAYGASRALTISTPKIASCSTPWRS